MMTMEACWSALGITPVRDKKAIKRAYAKQLKHTRPDEDPEGFKALHAAYAQCLDLITHDWYWADVDQQINNAENTAVTDGSSVANVADRLTAETSTTPAIEPQGADIQAVPLPNQPIQIPEQPIQTITVKHTKAFAVDYPENNLAEQLAFKRRIKQLAWDKKKRNDKAVWQDYLANPLLLNIEFKQSISFYVIEQLLELRETQVKFAVNDDIPASFITPGVLRYLGEFFNWQYAQQAIETQFYEYASLGYVLNDLADAESFEEDDSQNKRFDNEAFVKVMQKEEKKVNFSFMRQVLFYLFIVLAISLAKNMGNNQSNSQDQYQQHIDALMQDKEFLEKYPFYINEDGELDFKESKEFVYINEDGKLDFRESNESESNELNQPSHLPKQNNTQK